MKVIALEPEPIEVISFLNAGKGTGAFYTDSLRIHLGIVDQLPAGTAAIVATADLQGRETLKHASGKPPRLLGEVLPAILQAAVFPTLNLPDGKIGAVLAGDFYTVPGLDKRGGSGDVTGVWRAFAGVFDWVVGVAGNHDTFGRDFESKPALPPNSRLLDNKSTSIGNLKIAGLSGIIGNPSRPWRRTASDFVDSVVDLLSYRPDILIMHDGPDCPANGYPGVPMVRDAIATSPPTFIVRGHAHWKHPLAEIDGGHQVLNVDARAVILIAQPRL